MYRLFIIALLFTVMSCSSENTSQSMENSDSSESITSGEEKPIESKLDANYTNNSSSKLMESESFKKIAAFLPETIDEMTAGPFEGWAKEEDKGPKFTHAKKTFRNKDKRSRIDISIADAGALTLESLGLGNYWRGKSINTGNDTNYEKTTSFQEFPAFEKCSDDICDFIVEVGDRFLITGSVENVSLNDLKNILETIDYEGLQKLAK